MTLVSHRLASSNHSRSPKDLTLGSLPSELISAIYDECSYKDRCNMRLVSRRFDTEYLSDRSRNLLVCDGYRQGDTSVEALMTTIRESPTKCFASLTVLHRNLKTCASQADVIPPYPGFCCSSYRCNAEDLGLSEYGTFDTICDNIAAVIQLHGFKIQVGKLRIDSGPVYRFINDDCFLRETIEAKESLQIRLDYSDNVVSFTAVRKLQSHETKAPQWIFWRNELADMNDHHRVADRVAKLLYHDTDGSFHAGRLVQVPTDSNDLTAVTAHDIALADPSDGLASTISAVVACLRRETSLSGRTVEELKESVAEKLTMETESDFLHSLFYREMVKLGKASSSSDL